jgi:hypothetical protein
MMHIHAIQHAHDEVWYLLCPHCLRAVPAQSQERYCANDGNKLLEQCPACSERIRSPFARHCTSCGMAFTQPKSNSNCKAQIGRSVYESL